MADSEIGNVSELSSVTAPTKTDAENIKKTADIKTSQSKDLTSWRECFHLAAYKSLLVGETKAICFEQCLWKSGSSKSTQITPKNQEDLYQKEPTKTVEAPKVSQTRLFNIYISGIDTYGPISSVSRSMSISSWRLIKNQENSSDNNASFDACVPIADGGNNQNDKLTHAGIYGVDAHSSLENPYGIRSKLLWRLQLHLLLEINWLLGGVDVYNDQDFHITSWELSFPVGNVLLNSEQALGLFMNVTLIQWWCWDRDNQTKGHCHIIQN